ncbi:MAG: DUF2937 family protein [Proteobacteria bacterium]|nr:MAG: DUF2937 family protein [Pseudomonadota bacterium]
MIKNLLDKIVFAIGVIVFLQLPQFIDQYTQRIGGYVASQQAQIAEYQVLADKHFKGDLAAYIARLRANADPVIADSAHQIDAFIRHSDDLAQEAEIYESKPLWYTIPYFITHFRVDLVQGTAKNFTPGMPINIWSWLYGLLGGLLFSLVFNGLVKLPSVVMRKKSPTFKNNHPTIHT